MAVFEWLRRFAIWRGQELWDWIPCTRYGASAEACEHVRPYGSPRDDMRNTRTPNFEQQEHHAERHAEGERGERKKREIGSDGERKKAGKPKH